MMPDNDRPVSRAATPEPDVTTQDEQMSEYYCCQCNKNNKQAVVNKGDNCSTCGHEQDDDCELI